ncbi:MAG: ricin-type beta-trefoil lectin domain protein [Streptomyces sp.]|nr:ricin-type beta-trefoil lectin domain protein [Streptomyces sp.]
MMKKLRLATVTALSTLAVGAGMIFPSSAQAATYWTFENGAWNTCLTAGDSGVAYHTTCQGSNRQQWDWVGSGHGQYLQLKNRETGKCLTTDFKNSVNAVWTSTCGAAPDQWWYYRGSDRALYNEGEGNGSTGFLRTSPTERDAVYTSSLAGSPVAGSYFTWIGSHT